MPPPEPDPSGFSARMLSAQLIPLPLELVGSNGPLAMVMKRRFVTASYVVPGRPQMPLCFDAQSGGFVPVVVPLLVKWYVRSAQFALNTLYVAFDRSIAVRWPW